MKILYKIKLFNELYQILHKENEQLVVKCNNYVLLNGMTKMGCIDLFVTKESKSNRFLKLISKNGQFIENYHDQHNFYLYIIILYM